MRLALILLLLTGCITTTRQSTAAMADTTRPRVRLHLVSDDPHARLTAQPRVTTPLGTSTWGKELPACTAPCGEDLPREALFVAGGPGIAPSRAFEIEEESRDVTVYMKAGDAEAMRAGHLIGVIGMVAGSVAMSAGFVEHVSALWESPAGWATPALVMGALSFGGGAGAFLWGNAQASEVQVHPGPPTRPE